LGISEDEQRRLRDLLDAFGALKQEFVATRYLAWLAGDYDSPIREHASAVSAKVKFLDSLSYVRWGARTGLAVGAFAGAMNLLDKVAGFVHLYLETGRVRDVYFGRLWHRGHPAKPAPMDTALADELRAGNRGLLALCDLSCDLDPERQSPLAEFIEMRHSATHRFLVAHDMLLEERTPTSEWVQRVEHRELLEATRQLLGTGRAALLYLARTVDIRERRTGFGSDTLNEAAQPAPDTPASDQRFERRLRLPLHRAATEHPDY